jgi:septal ring factor EnvC (AmiA/AmiB activator)
MGSTRFFRFAHAIRRNFRQAVQMLPAVPTVWPRSVLEAVQWLQEQQRQFEQERQQWRYEAEQELAQLNRRAEELQRQQQDLTQARTDCNRPLLLWKPTGKLCSSNKNSSSTSNYACSSRNRNCFGNEKRLDALYQHRRDHLRALRESVRRAAAKVQREKRQLASELESFRQQQQSFAQQYREYESAVEQLRQQQQRLDEERRLVAEWQAELEQELQTRSSSSTPCNGNWRKNNNNSPPMWPGCTKTPFSSNVCAAIY